MTFTTLIDVPAWGTVTIIEGLWLMSGLVALFFTASHIRPLYDDWVAARLDGRPELQLIAGAYLRREVLRFLQGTCLVIIGGYAALEESATGRNVTSPVGLVLTFVLLSLAALVSVQSWWDWRTRREVTEIVLVNGHGGR